jgi:amino acid adenylation domain-containing protein
MSRSFAGGPELSPKRRALVEALLRKEGLTISGKQAIVRRTCGNVAPLSFHQQRLWFLHELEPNSDPYKLCSAFRLTGRLDLEALQRALETIVARHEVIRTTYTARDGVPVQVIAESSPFELQMTDLTQVPQAERNQEIQRFLREEASCPFDLSSDLMLRARVLRLELEEHILVLVMHHIASDEWSRGVLFRELAALYEAFSLGQPSPVHDLPIQYADYAVWQLEWLQGEVLQNQLLYWKKQLDNVSLLQLPTDHPRPPVLSHRGASQSLVLPKDLSEKLKTLGRKEGATLFMTLLATFQILMHRYTGQEDIVVGSPIAGRNRSEIESLIGFFVNTLVLRTDLSNNPTFTELLARVREVAVGAYAHQDIPFEKLVEELQPERDLSRTPLFQIFFTMLNLESPESYGPELCGLAAEPLMLSEPDSKFDLTLYARENNEEIHLTLVYNADLFDAPTVTRMLGHYRTLLAGVVANPDHSIASISVLTEQERDRLSTRNHVIRATKPFIEFREEDTAQSIPSRFEQQAKKYPDHVAVKTRSHQWTYRQLDQTANRIAETLLNACGRDNERVGLLFNHDAPMVAGILGALKAGKTYVPLDPAYPMERLAYMLEDSQAVAMLTDHRSIDLARTLMDGRLQIINIDDCQKGEATKPDIAISPDTLAYILYTSGSTGRPKGVMQNHRNVLHFIRVYTNSIHVSADDKLTLFSSYSHDAAIVDIFAALLNGATVCPWSVKEQGLAALAAWILQEKITIYHSTRTFYESFLDSLDRRIRFPELQAVVLGGEAALQHDFVSFQRQFSQNSIFFNLYGATESSINLLYPMNGQTTVTQNTLPIGYPVEDTEVRLVNEAGEEAELYGEIAIRSAHVALGYWGQPEMTRNAFLPDPVDGTKRIYRTGDMGRLLRDGSIAFIGRKDFQVKMRGFRIELGEIEAVLREHPDVREAVVVAREEVENPKSENPNSEIPNPKSAIGNSQSRGRRLVAYIVLRQQPAPTIKELRGFLKQKLPEYMVPSAFVFVDSLPFTPNGKIDRRALPAPDRTRAESEESFVAPRTPVEETLAKIWAEVLRLKRVGVHDNFFDLGGHSLLATQVMARVRSAFQVDVPLRALFEKPTVGELATVIAGQKAIELDGEEFSSTLAELESLSEEETQRLLLEQGNYEGMKGE